MSHYGFGFGIGQVKKAGSVSYDADAQAFFTATGITDTTQKSAVNQLVLDLKSYNIWTKMKAVYPIVGGTSTTHKYNLVNPLDTDAAYRLTFSTGWTHSSTGMTPSSAFANTYIVPSTKLSLNSAHLSYYATTAGIPASTGVQMGSVVNLGDFAFMQMTTDSTGTHYPLISCGSTGTLGYTPSRYNSLLIANRTNSSTMDGWANNTKTSITKASYALNTANIYIGARNNSGTAQNYGTNQCRFASIGDGLTDTEASNFYTAVQNYQTTLGRNV